MNSRAFCSMKHSGFEAVDSVEAAPIAKTGIAGAPVEAVAYLFPVDPVVLAGVGLSKDSSRARCIICYRCII